MIKIKIIVEKTSTGLSAYAMKYPVYTVSENFKELKHNIIEALNLYFENKGKSFSENDFEILNL